MGDLLQPTHILILAIVLLLLFGAKRLPEMGKGLGEGLKGFKEGLKGASESSPAQLAQQASAPAPPDAPAGPPAMEYVTCSRCGNRFENPYGFKVADFVCRSCQQRS
ncbi:MAG: twin-arginine translocase TatA/TatE family subunit [Terracidiphilus sp.]